MLDEKDLDSQDFHFLQSFTRILLMSLLAVRIRVIFGTCIVRTAPESVVVIFHSHHAEPYYMNGRANTLRQAVRGIERHDRWQMNGRKWQQQYI